MTGFSALALTLGRTAYQDKENNVEEDSAPNLARLFPTDPATNSLRVISRSGKPNWALSDEQLKKLSRQKFGHFMFNYPEINECELHLGRELDKQHHNRDRDLAAEHVARGGVAHTRD